MNKSAKLLLEFVEQDFGLEGSGNYYRSRDHDSLVIDVQKGLFYWNSRDIFGNPVDYLTKVRRMRYGDAVDLVNSSIGKIPVYVKEKSADVPFKPLAEIFWRVGKDKRDYWYKRLLTDKTIDKFKLGYNNGWSTLPIFENDRLLNIQLRRDYPSKGIIPYYRTDPVLFNVEILKSSSNVILCEGIVDAILLSQLGVPAVSKLGGAETWLPVWYSYFINQKNIYLIFDNDLAGMRGATKISEALGTTRCKIYTFKGFKPKYDIVDFFRDGNSLDSLIDIIKKKSRYIFEISEQERKTYN